MAKERSTIERALIAISERYPRLATAMREFFSRPFSGDALRAVHKESLDQQSVEEKELLQPPHFGSGNKVVIAQYTNYTNPRFANYWSTTGQIIREQYNDDIQYRHYDIPPIQFPRMGSPPIDYALASIGRSVQDQCGNKEFWRWFSQFMNRNIETKDEAISMAENLFSGISSESLNEGIDKNMYKHVFVHTTQQLLSRPVINENEDQSLYDDTLDMINDRSEDVFLLFINGTPVEPIQDNVIGIIQELST